jgi:hypothetical protein
VDDVQLLEWRAASGLPDGFYAVHALRGAAGPFTIERTVP